MAITFSSLLFYTWVNGLHWYHAPFMRGFCCQKSYFWSPSIRHLRLHSNFDSRREEWERQRRSLLVWFANVHIIWQTWQTHINAPVRLSNRFFWEMFSWLCSMWLPQWMGALINMPLRPSWNVDRIVCHCFRRPFYCGIKWFWHKSAVCGY